MMRKRRRSLSVERLLLQREVDWSRRTRRRFEKLVYLTIVPNRTAFNVREVPAASIRRFTPDGRYMMSFATNRRDIILYCVDRVAPDRISTRNDRETHGFYEFAEFFPYSKTIKVANDNEELLEFCLCSSSSQYGVFILRQMDANNERDVNERQPSITPCIFTVVNLHGGVVIDRRVLEDGLAIIERNLAVHMFENRLAIVSSKFQVTHIMDLREEDGSLHEVLRIGPYVNNDDEIEVLRVKSREENFVRNQREHIFPKFGMGSSKDQGKKPEDDILQSFQAISDESLRERRAANTEISDGQALFTGFRQKLLVQSFKSSKESGFLGPSFMSVLMKNSRMSILKVQLLDDNHLLMLLGPSNFVSGTAYNNCSFVVYSLNEREILGTYAFNSCALARIYENNAILFEVTSAGPDAAEDIARSKLLPLGEAPPNISRVKARERAAKLLRYLPVSAQKRNWSPYFDRSIYQYDVTKLEFLDGSQRLYLRPHEEPTPVKFLAKDTQKLSFRLKIVRGRQNPSSARFSGFLFHPHLPLCLVFQQTAPSAPPQLDIHYRCHDE
mmetsp:Transcript_13226/g.40656  ORF Transcript_13226/g.40656 Transcript_13226/m.40656 type:complete len:557 (+) Transcript_13226:132-1802(+)|eukprot:CAMPEP_0198730680 /NCGR_PEP_ID=MMETSP1475-20131203/25595_1 /TAXON_ID= ORGANISM="Unidentified sp., Strain CCMP1999" /NCGR_SAMPLE_ID=MMETSP1475 /ASSEMBLY_ACC=CAM_ASM_001111 /LENGTH=556 /DNA_ID=CAMNT_0044493519 /DNA_START=115 /DNA_END=1785 /DNA_ORIENTATION=+